MSSPEYAEMRGIPGTAVAAKAQLYNEVRKRSLLFFLQSLSLQHGGLRKVARDLIEAFPKRPADRNREEELAHLLVEFCINPKCIVRFSDDKMPDSVSVSPCSKLADALRDLQDRYEAKIKSDFVLTTIGKEVFETLDHALDIGKMVVIEGESGSGKTTAVEAWCAVHQGQVRFVSLSGITHKTGFFRKLATAIGLAAAKGKATDMQLKVEEFFHKTRLMLVIDEAHYLWPQYHRSESSPELVDWVNTALVNHHVPVALICTDQFAKLKAGVEKRTGWTGEQFEHRVKRYKKLPSAATNGDLEAVARKMLAMRWNSDEQKWSAAGPKPDPDFVKMVVGYALTCKMRLPAVADTITEARHQAHERGRFCVAATDIRNALLDYRIPSDEALQQAFETPTSRSTNSGIVRNPQFGVGAHLQSHCNRIATALH
jgi:ABC-type glutathione transport system ATPase component